MAEAKADGVDGEPIVIDAIAATLTADNPEAMDVDDEDEEEEEEEEGEPRGGGRQQPTPRLWRFRGPPTALPRAAEPRDPIPVRTMAARLRVRRAWRNFESNARARKRAHVTQPAPAVIPVLVDDDDPVCTVCNDNDDQVLLCDGCSEGVCHTYCATPRLDSVPEGWWFCAACSGIIAGGIAGYHDRPAEAKRRRAARMQATAARHAQENNEREEGRVDLTQCNCTRSARAPWGKCEIRSCCYDEEDYCKCCWCQGRAGDIFVTKPWTAFEGVRDGECVHEFREPTECERRELNAGVYLSHQSYSVH